MKCEEESYASARKLPANLLHVLVDPMDMSHLGDGVGSDDIG